MKRNIIKSIMVAVFAIFAGYNVYQANVKTEELSDIMMANVEALAQNENNKNYDCIPPYDKYTCSYEGSIKLPGIKYIK